MIQQSIKRKRNEQQNTDIKRKVLKTQRQRKETERGRVNGGEGEGEVRKKCGRLIQVSVPRRVLGGLKENET